MDCFTHLSGDSPRVCSKKRKATCAPVLDRVSASFPPFYNVFPGIRQPSRPLSYNVWGSLMHVWVWNILVTYYDVPDLHIHGVYVSAFVRVHGYTTVCTYHANTTHTCMHTQHTHHTSRVCSCLFRSGCMHLFETVSRGAFMCDVRCTAQICYSWDNLGIEGAGVRKCLSLSERGGTTS